MREQIACLDSPESWHHKEPTHVVGFLFLQTSLGRCLLVRFPSRHGRPRTTTSWGTSIKLNRSIRTASDQTIEKQPFKTNTFSRERDDARRRQRDIADTQGRDNATTRGRDKPLGLVTWIARTRRRDIATTLESVHARTRQSVNATACKALCEYRQALWLPWSRERDIANTRQRYNATTEERDLAIRMGRTGRGLVSRENATRRDSVKAT